jgi:ribosomal protein L14E/L6E/L27E
MLIDGPFSGIERTIFPLSRLSLTDFKLKIGRGSRTGTIAAAWKAEKV